MTIKILLRRWLGIKAEHTLLYEQQLNVIKRLNSLLDRVERLEKKTSGLELGEAAHQGGGVEHIFGSLSAIEKKIGRIMWRWVDDPNRIPDAPPQVREWFIGKKL